ncbi:chitin synthase-domain-containing protein [Zopfochytrium polystomum]|nr:chitin synthase-domain-containing protein [Zopfochytrium polystomum]
MDVPVSKRTLMHATHDGSGQNGEEFTHLRYTAVTCKAQEFNQEKYTLRAKNFGRKIRIAIVITMYNENDKLFCRTFRGVMKNIAFLCSGECAFWDRDSWKEIVVVIVADGRAKIHPSVLTVWGVQGLFMEGIEKSSVNGKQVLAHMFEFSTQLSIDKNLRIQENVCDDSDHLSLVPCQTILLIKSKNAKKINSHRWFFELCKVLSPEMCVLLDVGTKPRKRSLFHLSEAFRTNGKVGGACGEIVAQLGRYGTKLFNPLVAVQNFEYKISNVLDKPLESVFGYISVLPGAFSAYRYEAILGQPLEKYFKGDHSEGAPEQVSNINRAEDRILCFEVVMKADKNWILKYVKSAVAETDVPRTLDELIAQRRRWLNGSFFAAIHATLNMSRIFKSRHTMFRKWMLVVVFVYNVVNLLFTWCGLGHFYLAFYFLFDVSQSAGCTSTGSSTVDPFYPSGQAVFTFLNDSYILAIVIIFVLSLGNRPQANPLLYTAISAIFAIIMFFILFISIWTIRASLQAYYAQNSLVPTGFWAYATSDSSFRDIVLSVMVTYGLYLLSSTIHLQLGHILICGIPYLLMTPTFTNILNVYAFCNLHDISWGTKGDNTVSAAPAVVTQRSEGGQNVAVVEIPFEAEDVDEQWMGMYEKLNQESKGLESRKEVTKIDPKTKQDDFYKNFRTKVLLCWVITNYMIIFVFTNDDIVNAMFPNRSSGTNLNPYFTFLLWSVTLLSCIKFTFSAVYLIGWHVDGLRQGGKRNIAAKFIKKTDSGGSF